MAMRDNASADERPNSPRIPVQSRDAAMSITRVLVTLKMPLLV